MPENNHTAVHGVITRHVYGDEVDAIGPPGPETIPYSRTVYCAGKSPRYWYPIQAAMLTCTGNFVPWLPGDSSLAKK